MSFFKTPTPGYGGQTGAPAPREPDWLFWLKQLFKTPTPHYRKAPAHTAQVNDKDSR